jgi:hypothetical protein
MSQTSVLKFLMAARARPAMMARYAPRSLTQLLFHAKNDGFDFSPEDLADVVGKLEANVIVAKDQDPFNESSRLWRQMWGRTHFEYVIEQLIERHTDEELAALFEPREQVS